jgi:hypothetical protein
VLFLRLWLDVLATVLSKKRLKRVGYIPSISKYFYFSLFKY